ncbi:MAG: MarR family transcriptional regulator [Bacteroidales bacterium]|jgi:DNA-binding MarR family transcriptional regulator|nr:MarR family transcriptional regulator [Bacteroidales bacterium]MDN5350455.1 MarR family transcriptional regulator, organic hydroperoxide resistance regulator [Bacteroidales bacterium]
MSDFTDVLINLRKIVRSINLESKRIQKEFGISIPQLLCLHYLASNPGYQSTISGIAAYLNLNLSTVTGIVSRLEKKHLVARLPKSGDKRITVVSLTSSGKKLLDQSPELMHQQLSHKLAALPEEEIKLLKESLGLLVHCFNINDEPASPMITIDDFQY